MQNGFNNITKEQFLILENFNKVRTENIFNQSLNNLQDIMRSHKEKKKEKEMYSYLLHPLNGN